LDNIAFVVTSCLKYSDCWPVMMQSIKKYWPAIYDRTYILTESAGDFHDDYKFIVLPEDRAWSDNLIYLCEHLKDKYDYVFLAMEDGPLISPIDNKQVNEYFSTFMEMNGSFLTLLNDPYPSGETVNGLTKISLDSAYRPTTTCALWRLSKLQDLLVSGESAWDFEKVGANRSRNDDNYYSFKKTQIKVFHLVIKGKLFRNVRRGLAQFDLIYDGDREELGRFESLKMNAYTLVHRTIFKLTPYKLQKYLVRK